jgi:hypothetical protein
MSTAAINVNSMRCFFIILPFLNRAFNKCTEQQVELANQRSIATTADQLQ